jgi:hypothetical protein
MMREGAVDEGAKLIALDFLGAGIETRDGTEHLQVAVEMPLDGVG